MINVSFRIIGLPLTVLLCLPLLSIETAAPDDSSTSMEAQESGSVRAQLPKIAVKGVTITQKIAADWTIQDKSGIESDSGPSPLIFAVEISDCSNETVKVDYRTSPGTATPGVDYQETSGTLTFPGPNPCPPQTVPGSAVISVIALGDTEPEPNETFFLTLSNPRNSTIADGTAIALILDDDSPFGFNDVSVESGIANNNIQTTGVQWIDYNRDKRLDLYLVGKNGNALFKNLGNGKFKNVTKTTKTSNNGKDGRGASQENGDSLLENIGGSGNHTLTVVLEGRQSQRDGIGSTVVVQTGFSEFQRKTVTAGNGKDQGSFALVFGLGPNLEVDFLRIFWPSSPQTPQTLQHVNADQVLPVVESHD